MRKLSEVPYIIVRYTAVHTAAPLIGDFNLRSISLLPQSQHERVCFSGGNADGNYTTEAKLKMSPLSQNAHFIIFLKAAFSSAGLCIKQGTTIHQMITMHEISEVGERLM